MDVAIVGIGCRLPGEVDTPAAFWKLLRDGGDAIAEIPPERFDVDAVYDPDPAAPGKIYSRWGGFLHGVDRFDADFFGISPREAKRMDPQHRLLLEVAWEALEDAGLVPERLAGTRSGVFVGISTHDYADLHMAPGQRPLLDAHVNIGNALCAAPNRLSYLFDLRGPSLAIETACSSSLTAVHLARRSLAAGECSLALVAGVNLVLSPDLTIGFCKASMISPDGRCRAFDARANGYVRSEGAGAVVLKPLARAVVDGDPIYAVLRGSGINEDGRTTGISLPSATAQEQVIREALRDAGVEASGVGYVEAHGTGTAAGDPAEAQAIGRVYGRARAPGEEVLVGSAKTNVGHLEAAAGITGLIKAALVLHHRQIPPSLHFEEPNPDIPFEDLRLRVPTTLESWPDRPTPAMVGVSASGFGGANAHVVLGEPPVRPALRERDGSRPYVLTLSARSGDALRRAAERYGEHLTREGAPALRDLCHTAAVRRTHHEHRLAAVGRTADELVGHLDAFLAKEAVPGLAVGRCARGREPKLAFVFAGMGPQWWAMGRQLLRNEPVFRDKLEECDDALRPLSGWSLMEELAAEEAESRIGETRVVQVANCALQVALAALWRSWGVVPDAVVGHSAGEMAAAHVSGALGLRDALRVAYHRGRLLQRMEGRGTMLAAAVTAEDARSVVEAYRDRVSLAAVNSPTSVTFSGETSALEEIARSLEARERFHRFLPTEVPYHAPQVEEVRDELLEALEDLEPAPSRIPMVSEVTGSWIGDALLDANYWWRNIREPVRFAACLGTLIEDDHDLFCEVGPHPVLATYVQECLTEQGRTGTVVPTLRRHEDEGETMLRTLATLHARGRAVDWASVLPEGLCVPLPPYPWQRERYWFDPPAASAVDRSGVDTKHPLLGRRLSSPRWIWQSSLPDPRLDYLHDHVIEGGVVFPGAGYVEIALAAARNVAGDAPVLLEAIEFRKLLFLEEGRDTTLQTLHDPDDATLEVHAAGGGEPASWSLHATATLRTGAAPEIARMEGVEGSERDRVRDRCGERVAAEDYYALLERYGFRYGEAFRGLEQVWAGEGEALARVRFPDELELRVDAYEVHPALLDAAFQLLVAAAGGASAGRQHAPSGPLFPVEIGRVAFDRPPGERFWVHAVVRQATDTRIEGDVALLDGTGTAALRCEGVRFEVLDEARADAPRRDGDDWLYELEWEEAPLAGGGSPRPARVRSAADVSEALAGDRLEPRPFDDYDVVAAPVLDRVATAYARAALVAIGWDAQHERSEPAEVLGAELGVVPRHRRLFRELVEMVREAGAEERDGGGPVRADHAALRRELEVLVDELPGSRPQAELLRRGGEPLARVLRGEVDAREILFADDALELLTRFYHDAPVCRAYHARLADAVAAAVEAPPDREPARVLEVGAGTGAATAMILDRLPASTEYVFTDISPHFVTVARDRLGGRPGLRFELLDIEKDPREQGFTPGSFDVVVAANVLHTTADLRESIGQLRRLLAPGGLLALLELARPSAWFNLVFGLLDGWWRFTDADVRSDSPLLGVAGWQGLLARDFEHTTVLHAGEREGRALQALLLANEPAERASLPTESEGGEPRRWLILADGGGVGERFAASLRRRGDACFLAAHGPTYRWRAHGISEVPTDDPSALARLLRDARAAADALHGVVHLWSLDTADAEAPTAEVTESQRLGSESALAVIQALEHEGGEAVEVWLVTAGSQPVEGKGATPNVVQAPLWGLGRVYMNEAADRRCRLVDLGPEPLTQELEALAVELHSDAPEEEIGFRAGRRYVQRLRRAKLDPPAERTDVRPLAPDTESFCLGSVAPGGLETLVLRETPEREPGPGELAIRVRASGLNFRDVLLALGMLPEAAQQTDPHPHLLGIECSGVVEACGEGVDDFRPGDEVIALAWGAHGSRVVTRPDLTVLKPAGLSFAEAASVTTGFVTAEYALRHVARVAPGERVLLHSATGAVGLAAIQLCRRMGVEVLATAGTTEKREHLRSLGVDHVMDSRSLDFVDQVRARTGGDGVDAVLNTLAGEAMRASLDLLRPYGRFVELGKRDIYRDARIGLLPFRRNLTYTAVDLIRLALDRPGFAKRLLLDVVEQISDARYVPVPHTAFDLGDAERAFRFMAQARHIGKVVLTVDAPRYPVRSEREPQLCDAEGTYLITGGLGGFGLTVASWLVEQGARTIVLMSRSGEPKDEGALAALQGAAEHVSVVKGDAACSREVARVLDHIREELPPLKGVVHAAMVLDDDALDRLDRHRFRSVLAPKVGGAWNLHRQTASDPLDFFVLFSSVASVFGHPMQGNYAAANAFLDSLAAHRRARGLPALTIGWGTLAEVGYVARHPELARYLTRGGFEGFAPEQALGIMEALLRRDRPHVIAARVDWARVAEANPLLASSRRFSAFFPVEGLEGRQPAEGADVSPLLELERVDPKERPEWLERYVAVRVARVLGHRPERIDVERPLNEMGFDSLMAVELNTAIKSELEVRLPVVKILQGVSTRELAQLVLDAVAVDARPAPDADASSAGDETPSPAPEEAVEHPLSFEQRRLWFLHRLAPHNPAYNVPTAAGLSGSLDLDALERGLNAAVARHEVLRARFHEVDGEPVQRFEPPVALPLPLVDLTGVPAEQRDAELERRATELVRRPFDLDQGPLLRAVVFRLAPHEHVLLLVVHHIACDAWSMNWFAREVASLYEAISAGRSAARPAPTFRYVDYVHRERERLGAHLVESQLEYWVRQLAGAETKLRLPGLERSEAQGLGSDGTARAASPRHMPERGGHEPFELSPELTSSFEELCRGEGATLFMGLLAVFQTLLRRYSDQDDICVATPVATREPEARAVVGCFMNTLVLRGDLSGDPPFRAALQRTRAMVLEAFEHQDVPFERVVEAVRRAGGGGDPSLAQAMLVLHSARLPELRVAGLDVRPVDVESGTAVCDLALLVDSGERLTGVLEYNADRFDRETARRILGHLRTLVEGVVTDPHRRLSELPLMSAEERRKVLVEWNDTAVDFGTPRCLHELVETQTRSTPHAEAVRSGAGSLTYQELDHRANRIACYLRRLKVGPEAVVGLFMDRCLEAVVAILATLKAGAAYLPLDPRHPQRRLEYQLRDAGVAAVLTREQLKGTLPPHPAPVVAVDGEWERGAPSRVEGLDSGVTADNLAYVLYTSGSTGRPKGVMVEHRAVWNHLLWRQRAFPLSTTDAVLQSTPLTFDPSVWELFGPLSAGARVVLPDPDRDGDVGALVRRAAEAHVTVLQAVPSVLDALLDEPGATRCRDLRYVFCGGEPLWPELRERFFACLPAELHHVYGPTEATIETTHWCCEPGKWSARVPIGRPIANVKVQILDEHLRPVPIGVTGELCIGGAGLARGYLGRPELTRRRFFPGTSSDGRGGRLYRSGDLARWRPDGSIEFLGRRDGQVKIRGHRVETGEVEAALAEDPAVREAAVVSRAHAPGDRRLTAFVVPEAGGTSPAAIRRHAEERLPRYMVPSVFTFRDSLPRTSSGKVDRGRLAREALQRRHPASKRAVIPSRNPDERVTSAEVVGRPVGAGTDHPGPVPPRDRAELRLARLWRDLFPDRPFGVTDDFFELGGHSLLAMRAVSRIRDAFGIDLPVSSLIEERTIEGLAHLLRRADRPDSPLVVVQPRGSRPPFFCVHPIGGSVFCYLELARALGDARPFYALEAVGLSEGEEPLDRIEEMAATYIEAVRRLRPAGPYLLGGWSMGGVIAFEMARQLVAVGEQIPILALLDARPIVTGASAPQADPETLVRLFAHDLGLPPHDRGSAAREATTGLPRFPDLPTDQRLRSILEEALTANLLPPGTDLAALKRRLEVFTHHLRAMREYVPGRYPGRITVIEAGDGPGAAWEELADGGVSRHRVGGNHYTMLRPPHVQALAECLVACLEEPGVAAP